MTDSNYQKWKSLQAHWDDDEFLKSLTPLMKLRYRRLDEKVEAILDENFHAVGAFKDKPLVLGVGAGRGEVALFLPSRGRKRVWGSFGFDISS